MNEHAPLRSLVIGAVLITLVGAGAAYAYASWHMASRVDAYRRAISSIGYGRGGQIPDAPAFTAAVEEAAAPLGLELRELAVDHSDESGRDVAGEAVQRRLGAAATIRMELVRYRVTATVVARKWLFTETTRVEADRAYRREVHLDVPSAPARHPLPPVAPTERGL